MQAMVKGMFRETPIRGRIGVKTDIEVQKGPGVHGRQKALDGNFGHRARQAGQHPLHGLLTYACKYHN